MTAVLTAIRRVLVGTGSTAFTLVGALLIGFGVPLFWIFVASQFYGKTGAVNGPVAVFIGTGILVSYYGLLLIASCVRARLLRRRMGTPGQGEAATPGTGACGIRRTSRASIRATRWSGSSSRPRSSR